MKTISDYKIPCTPEQTKKAFNLGAPIKMITFARPMDGQEIVILDGDFYKIPTAEEMTGFLEKQGVIDFCVDRGLNEYIEYIDTYEYLVAFREDKLVGRGYKTRKEATLAAIDAALEFLSNK